MAHRIEDNMLAFQGMTPWHGLGVNVPTGTSGQEMLKLAKLDWQVVSKHLAILEDQERSGRMQFRYRAIGDPQLIVKGSVLDGYRAIMREDTGQVFQIATNRYHPLQNQEIVDFFREFCGAGHATMETVGAIDGGRVVFALAKLTKNGSDPDATLPGGDEIKGYLLMSTSHDGSVRTIASATNIRVVCMNTLSAAWAEAFNKGKRGKAGSGVFMKKHSHKWTSQTREEAKKAIGMACEAVQKTNELAQKLSQVKLDYKGQRTFVNELLGKVTLQTILDDTDNSGGSLLDQAVAATMVAAKESADTRVGRYILDAILDSPGSEMASAKGTMWGAVNGVTYYVDHVRSRSQDTRLEQAWYGTGEAMKTQAMVTAVKLAGISV